MWIALWALNHYLTRGLQVTNGISLVYFPAGYSLLVVLLFGFWGALGIFLFNPLLFLAEFTNGSTLDVLVTSAISGFSPLVVISLCRRAIGIESSLAGLSALHLPILALAVSLTTPLLFNAFYGISGLHPMESFWRDYIAMASGDFLGCAVVIGLIRIIIAAVRIGTGTQG